MIYKIKFSLALFLYFILFNTAFVQEDDGIQEFEDFIEEERRKIRGEKLPEKRRPRKPRIVEEDRAILYEEIDSVKPEELTNPHVTVASKKKEKASKSPAIVTVITSEEITKSGYDNLYQILSTVPGVEFIESFFGSSQILFRGVSQEHFNNKSLLLVNGRPIHEHTYGTYYLEKIPLSAIEKIEIIRGPGSALYGANAYTGLISITTKKVVRRSSNIEFGNKVGVFADHNDRDKIKFSTYNEVAVQKKLAEDMYFNFFSSGKFQQPFQFQGTPAQNLTLLQKIDYKDNFLNFYSTYRVENFELNAFYFYQNKAKFGFADTTSIFLEGDNNIHFVGGDVLFSHKIGNVVEMKYQAFGDYYERVIKLPYSEGFPLGPGELDANYSGYKAGGTIESLWTFFKHYSMIIGIYGEYYLAKPYEINDPPNEALAAISPWTDDQSGYDLAAYFQAKVDILNIVNITGGLRYNYNNEYGSTNLSINSTDVPIIPRGGINFIIYEGEKNGVYLKGLYGYSIRNPSFFEKYSESLLAKGVPDLKPESMHAADGAIEYIYSTFFALRINYFYMNTSDHIRRQNRIVASPIYVNVEGHEIHGAEMDVQVYPLKGKYKKHLKINANASYRYAREKTDNSIVENVPQLLVNFRLDYNVLNFFEISPVVQYVGSRNGTINSIDPRFPNPFKQTIADYILVHAFLKVFIIRNNYIELGVQNITDRRYSFPESVFGRATKIDGVTPYYGGRYYSVGYRARFRT